MEKTKPKIYCIVGPTASGKTDTSIAIAKRMNAEILSADSIQVYEQLNIGSAKPTIEERDGIPHHLLDCIPLNTEKFSVSEYTRLAKTAIYDIISRGKAPLIVGGTGLYINALTSPLNFADVGADTELRASLSKMEEEKPGYLHQYLTSIDPITAERLHPNDKKRLIRAIEVYTLSGKPLSQHGNDFVNSSCNETEFDARLVGITMPRELLYSRVEKRVDIMMEQGLLDEVKRLIAMEGFDPSIPAMQGLGYKQLIEHLLYGNPATLEEAVAKIKLETRHFAKRQLTWFRRDKRIHWIDITKGKDQAVNEALSAFNS